MRKEDFEKLNKEEKVEYVKPPEQPQGSQATTEQRQQKDLDKFDFSAMLEQLKTIKRPVATAPTFTPKNFLEQFVLYESGATRRLYVYINRTWRYVALT